MNFDDALKQLAAAPGETKKVAPLDILDAAPAVAQIKALEPQTRNVVLEAEAIEIKTDQEESDAVTIDGKMGRLLKDLEGKKKQLTAPHRSYINTVNGEAKKIYELVKASRLILKSKLRRFVAFKETERRRQQKAIEEANRKLQRELDEQAKRSGIEAQKVTPIKPPSPKTVSRGREGATTHELREWVGAIVDSEKVPREYCVPDMRKINRAIRAGVREILGVEIKEEVKLVTRSA